MTECRTCHVTKPAEAFSAGRRTCKACRRSAGLAYYYAHRGERLAVRKAYQLRHGDVIRAKQRAHRAAHAEEIRVKHKAWRDARKRGVPA